jgi:hypothetical protein
MRRSIVAVVACLLLAALNASGAHAVLTASVTIDRKGTVTREGLVTLSGAVTCTGATGVPTGYIDLLLDQRSGLSESATQVSVTCGSTPTTWTAPLGSFTEVPFMPGSANAHASLSVCSDVECVFPDRVDQLVHLSRRPA